MELVDIKLSKKESKEQDRITPASDGDAYSYGTRLQFENNEIEKVPSLALLKGGETVKIEAEAKVIETRIRERQDGTVERSVELQITKVGCSTKKPLESMSPKEYREARGK